MIYKDDLKTNLEAILQTIKKYNDRASVYHQNQQAIAANNFRTAITDGRIQIADRCRFDEYLKQQWKQMAKQQSFLTIVLCHVNGFQQLHTTQGCAASDACLKQIIAIFDRTVKRSADLTACWGESEFAVILPRTMINGARVLAKQLQAGVAALQIPQTQSCVTPLVNLSVSIVSTRPEIEQSPKTLVDEADRLLRLAKQRSSNQILHAFLD